MNKDVFFNAFAEDTKPPAIEPARELPAADKETYTRAEVDELITRKIAETLESMKTEPTAAPADQADADPAGPPEA